MTKHSQPNLRVACDGLNPSDNKSPADDRLSRRSFLAFSMAAGVTSLLPIGGLMAASSDDRRDKTNRLSKGDAAILRFLAAAELLETDLWQQYNELANGNPDYMAALQVLDGDMPAYVTQNTVNEFSHANFINAFLASRQRQPVNLDAFRTLPSSQATGAVQTHRLTNLMHLNVDTSWYTRYRSMENPDFGDTFPQAVHIVDRPGIPLHDGYSSLQIQAIANTAGFHFAMIEQGGASLYDAMSLKVTDRTVLRIVTSIGGTEVAHFQTWHDKAGNAPPLDTGDGLVFPDLNANPDTATNKILPPPCDFLSEGLPLCSVIRPTSLPLAGAMAVVHFLTDTGLFHGQSQTFFRVLTELADEADEAMFG